MHIRCGPPLTFPRVEEPSPFLAGEVDRAHLAVRRAPVGVARRPAAAAHRRRRRRRLDGHRRRGRARARRARGAARLPHRRPGRGAPRRARERALPARASSSTARSTSRPSPRSSSPAWTSWCSPCRARACRPRVGEIGARMGDRSAVLVASKGLVPPLGTTPAAYVSERVRARAVATLAGPAHAREAIELGASVVLATRDADLRRQLRDLLEAGGLTVEATDDVTGAELAACAKNAAALGSAAAAAARREPRRRRRRARLRRGPRAGARERRPQRDLRRPRRRGRPRGHRDRRGQPQPARGRAGRRGRARPGRCEASMDQTAESLATVPLLGLAFERQGIDAPVTDRPAPRARRRVLARAVARERPIGPPRAAPHPRGIDRE